MWQLLTSEEDDKRFYVNHATNSQCEQELLKIDRDGNKWWGFTNLLTMPYTRNFAATKVSSLYALGLSKDDLTGFIQKQKATLKSTDPEKYEKAYSEILDFESKANSATDAVRQMSSLVCVYYTLNDEPIDSFEGNLQIRKMGMLEADIELHSFFLKHQASLIERFTNHLGQISQTALPQLPELSKVLE